MFDPDRENLKDVIDNNIDNRVLNKNYCNVSS